MNEGRGVAPVQGEYFTMRGPAPVLVNHTLGTIVYVAGLLAMAFIPIAFLLSIVVRNQYDSLSPGAVLRDMGREGQVLEIAIYAVASIFVGAWVAWPVMAVLRLFQ